MTEYRTATVRTELMSRYPVDAPVTTEQTVTVELIPVRPGDLDVVAEKIDHGRKTRRFTIERVELRYRRVVPFDHREDLESFELFADQVPWEAWGVGAHGTSVRADGTRGTAAGYYHWPSQWKRDVDMPDDLARAVAAQHAWFEIDPA